MTTKKRMIYVSVAVVILYLFLVPFARNGFGYMGYYGYYNSPSWWYWNDTRYYYDKSARSGSVGGTNQRSGGPGRGK